MWGTVKGLLCTGSVPGLTFNLIGGTSKYPKLPLTNLLYLFSKLRRESFYSSFKCSASMTMSSMSVGL